MSSSEAHGGTILEEAQRITKALTALQDETSLEANVLLEGPLHDIYTELGYGQATPVDTSDLVDSRIRAKRRGVTPHMVTSVIPLSQLSAETTRTARKNITNIINNKDDRQLVIAGPCSIHDPGAALEYAAILRELGQSYSDELEIVMRVYFEKPRTELGWKGLAYDPTLDGAHNINLGLVASRLLAARITEIGVPIASERLNTGTPQFLNGMVAYDAIGARNTTDQKSREYASGTSSPVGFKNTAEGSILAAAEAAVAARAPHSFLGVGMDGVLMQVETTGNPTAHIILRGDQQGPNYSAEHIAKAKDILALKDLPEAIVIDCSHGNSRKDESKQIEVARDVARQISLGESAIIGVMIESNLVPGKQPIAPREMLTYAQSITDACVGIPETKEMFEILAEAVRQRRTAVQ